MQLFYTPDINGTTYTLNEDESKHCIRVLRMKIGDRIQLIDGIGGFYEAVVLFDNPRACKLEVTKKIEAFAKPSYKLHLAVAPTKNSDRLEWMLEKATEFGLFEFTPIICEHSERKNIQLERLERIAIAAMKQSVKAYLPKIHAATTCRDLIANSHYPIKLMAHCGEGLKQSIKDVLQPKQDVLIFIGPEGDFSPAEIALAQNHGCNAISLGNSRLRTETAALAACHAVYFINE